MLLRALERDRPIRFSDGVAASPPASRLRESAAYAIELAVICAIYFALAKIGLFLASINASATPIWPATGLALAAVLLRGYRVAPAILLGAFAANVTTAGTIGTSAVIGIGNMLEALIGAWLVNRWCGGCDAFATPGDVVRFALISLLATTLSPTIGIASLAFAGLAEWSNSGPIWLTWWLGDLAGALVISPALVLWAKSAPDAFRGPEVIESASVFAATGVIGVFAFSPLIEQTAQRAPLAFFAIMPLLWAALRLSQRETATVALFLSFFAVWATLLGGGPFARESLNESFMLVVMFMISTAVPSLTLSADAAMRRQIEVDLRRAEDAETTALQAINSALQKVTGHAETLQQRVSDPDALPELTAIATAARRGETLTQQLLTDTATRQQGTPVLDAAAASRGR